MLNQKGASTVFLFLFVVLAIALVATNLDKIALLIPKDGKSTYNPNKLASENAASSTALPYNAPCKKDGIAPSKDLKFQYTVQDGDTIDSIAQAILKDPTRGKEIAYLNKDKYGLYSVVNPITPGWVLDVPRPEIPKSSGILELFYGKYIGIDKGLLTFDGGGVTQSIPQIQFDDLQNKNEITKDVCYAVLTDTKEGVVLAVTPQ